jgi:hypothetical protein
MFTVNNGGEGDFNFYEFFNQKAKKQGLPFNHCPRFVPHFCTDVDVLSDKNISTYQQHPLIFEL